MITKHPIYLDFPEYADKIKDLYHNNDEFQVLLHSYTDLDEKIYKIETIAADVMRYKFFLMEADILLGNWIIPVP